MKLLFTLTVGFNPIFGGVQRTTGKLGKYFSEKGIEVAYYSLAKDGHIPDEYGRLYTAPEPGRSNNPANIADLRRVLKEIRPEVVINQMPYDKPLRNTLSGLQLEIGYHLLGCLRNSLFSVINNPDIYGANIIPWGLNRLLQNRTGRAFLKFFHKLSHRKQLKAIIDQHDFFILLTPLNREELVYFVGDYKLHKVANIPNSIPEVYSEALKKEKVILHVGRLNVQQKRSDLLLPFWKKTYGELPDWEFLIVGDGPYYEKLKEQIDKEQIPRIKMLGRCSPQDFYRRAPIFVMTAAYEGFPNVLIEAQSFGVIPVVFNSYPAVSWILNQLQDGILIAPFLTDDMSKEVIKLAKDEKRMENMGAACLENAKRFTIEEVGKLWEAFFADKLYV